MKEFKPSGVARYALVLVIVAMATALRFALVPALELQVPFILYFPAVVLCAWLGGLWTGVLGTALGGAIAWYVFIPPQYSFKVSDPTAPAQLGVFLLAGLLISLLAESLHRARRKAEESEGKEREERELLRVTLASIGDAVIATDSEGRISSMNPVAESLTGWSNDGASGRPLDEVVTIVNEQTRLPVDNPALRAMREGRIFGLANHTTLIAKNGTEAAIDDSGSPIKNAEGKTVGAVLIFRDVTERRKSEAARAILAAIVQFSEDVIISKSADGVISSWNPAAERLFEYTASEAIGQPITIIVPDDRLDEEQSILGRLSQGEHIEHLETVRRSKSGRLLDVSVTISPVRDSSGEVIGASKILRDITEKKRAEAALAQQRELLRVTLASIGDAVIATDTNGAVTFLNRVAESLTGWDEGQAVGQPLDLLFKIVNEQTRKEVENPALRAVREGLIVGLANHTVLIARDGAERPIDDSGAPIKDAQGNILGAVLIFRDITERREAEHERSRLLASERAAREQAEAASHSKDQFLAMVSHELRAPLNAILGWAQLMRSTNFNAAESNRGLERIERNARAQVRLIEDLLDISRVTAGKLFLNVSPVNIATFIDPAVESIRAAAEAKSIDIKVHLLSDENWVSGDPNRLQQIVWNLLSNAVKFTPAGGRVEVRAARVGSQLRISVSDSGIGISPEFLPHVFERFSQASTTSDRRYGGLGLGLSIVRHLVELHGGTVAVESQGEGKGATFSVTLPIDPVHQNVSRPIPSILDRPLVASPFLLEGLRILVVDDEPDTREVLAAMLMSSGADVKMCGSAREALETLKEWRPSLLASDIGMPGEDGYSLIRHVRSLGTEAGGDTPAVALTGYARSEDRTRALAAGFQTHVPKPIDANELIMVIASLTGRRGKL